MLSCICIPSSRPVPQPGGGDPLRVPPLLPCTRADTLTRDGSCGAEGCATWVEPERLADAVARWRSFGARSVLGSPIRALGLREETAGLSLGRDPVVVSKPAIHHEDPQAVL